MINVSNKALTPASIKSHSEFEPSIPSGNFIQHFTANMGDLSHNFDYDNFKKILGSKNTPAQFLTRLKRQQKRIDVIVDSIENTQDVVRIRDEIAPFLEHLKDFQEHIHETYPTTGKAKDLDMDSIMKSSEMDLQWSRNLSKEFLTSPAMGTLLEQANHELAVDAVKNKKLLPLDQVDQYMAEVEHNQYLHRPVINEAGSFQPATLFYLGDTSLSSSERNNMGYHKAEQMIIPIVALKNLESAREEALGSDIQLDGLDTNEQIEK